MRPAQYEERRTAAHLGAQGRHITADLAAARGGAALETEFEFVIELVLELVRERFVTRRMSAATPGTVAGATSVTAARILAARRESRGQHGSRRQHATPGSGWIKGLSGGTRRALKAGSLRLCHRN
jgi:hypothetical protein